MLQQSFCETFHVKYRGIIIFVCSLTLLGCKKLVEVDSPVTSVNSLNVYQNEASAASALTGIYATISAATFSNGGITSLSLFPSLNADELDLHSSSNNIVYQNAYRNELSPLIPFPDYWESLYKTIYSANAAIEGLSKSTAISEQLKRQLIGEGKFMRAFCYFYLINLYGDVPLATTTSFQENSILSRKPASECWIQVIQDLKDAQSLLSEKYLMGDAISSYGVGLEERIRPTKWAATALLARSYLYLGNWADAEIQASEIINQSSFFALESVENAFKKNTKEAIWQLQPVNFGQNTQDAMLFVLPLTGPGNNGGGMYPIYLAPRFMETFENNDLRKSSWTGNVSVIINGVENQYYYPFKYKINTIDAPVEEYTSVLRLSEQYLIRSEARNELNNPGGAVSDLNIIRERAGLLPTSFTSQVAIRAAILNERRAEFFTEWGHRWFDLKRTGGINEIMTVVAPMKGGVWETTDQQYPIPLLEVQRNPNLRQNAGY